SSTVAAISAVWACATRGNSKATSELIRMRGSPSVAVRIGKGDVVAAVADVVVGAGSFVGEDEVERGALVERPAPGQRDGSGSASQAVGEEVAAEGRVGRDGRGRLEDLDVRTRGRRDVAAANGKPRAEKQRVGRRAAGADVRALALQVEDLARDSRHDRLAVR